jgi:hypothetical protein
MGSRSASGLAVSLLLLAWANPGWAGQQESDSAPEPSAASAALEAVPAGAVAVFPFGPAPGLEAEARSIAELVGLRIAWRPGARVTGPAQVVETLGDGIKRFAGCAQGVCAVEIAEALTVRYVVGGRVDRFGESYVISASVSDASAGGRPIARIREIAAEVVDFPYACDRVGDAISDALGLEKASFLELAFGPPAPPTAHLNLKFGNTIAALEGFSFSTFTLRFDFEADYYLRPYLLAWLETGIAVGRVASEGESSKGAFSLVPVTLGLKYVLFHQYEVRPYAGLGLGLGLIGDLVEAEQRKVSLHFNGLVGLAYVPWRRVGFNLEASLNFDELRISGGSSLLLGFNLNFGTLFLF